MYALLPDSHVAASQAARKRAAHSEQLSLGGVPGLGIAGMAHLHVIKVVPADRHGGSASCHSQLHQRPDMELLTASINRWSVHMHQLWRALHIDLVAR